MNVKRILSGGHSKNRIFADSVFDGLEKLFMFMSPVERSRVLDQVVEGLTVNVEVLDITTVESKASKIFHDISFTLGRFEILQVFHSLCNRLDSFGRYDVTKKLNLLQEEECFVRSCLEACLPKKVMVFVENREHLVFVLRLHFSIIDVGNCLFFPYERIEVNRHESDKEVWEYTQAIESTCVGVLFSTDYKTR